MSKICTVPEIGTNAKILQIIVVESRNETVSLTNSVAVYFFSYHHHPSSMHACIRANSFIFHLGVGGGGGWGEKFSSAVSAVDFRRRDALLLRWRRREMGRNETRIAAVTF